MWFLLNDDLFFVITFLIDCDGIAKIIISELCIADEMLLVNSTPDGKINSGIR